MFVDSLMFAVDTPHGGYDEEDHIIELELVKIATEEGKNLGVREFVIGGARLEFQGHSSIDGYDFCGLECHGGGDLVRMIRNFDDYNCCVTWSAVVTGTWVSCDTHGDCNTWQGRGRSGAW